MRTSRKTTFGRGLACAAACVAVISHTASAASLNAVPTFESIGVYWPAPTAAADCTVQFRKTGTNAWSQGLDLWYDARNNECRGSLVSLQPDTAYEIQVGPKGQGFTQSITAKTWSNSLKVARTVNVPAGSGMVAITAGGSASTGYVVYEGNGAVLDAGDRAQHNVVITAPYVIVRGFVLKGAQQDAIAMRDGAHDVIIEDNDISGWGRYNYTNSAGWKVGVDYDSGIHAYCSNAVIPLERVVIQRNHIHDPRYGANSWDWGHPAGPQGISFSFCEGNHVIRYNEITSADPQHYFNDGIGGEEQQSDGGFPNHDSDIYGNLIKGVWDDAIEAEGAMKNVRIWNNYMDQVAVGIATATVNRGPAYVFRNVENRSRQRALSTLDNDDRNTFSKTGRPNATYNGGRRYVLHNTLLQASDPSAQYGLGAGVGLIGTDVINTVSRNNIFHIWKDWWTAVDEAGGTGNDFDYDLHNGGVSAAGSSEANGVKGVPIYASGNGWQSEASGMYQLAANSPGYDQGVRLPNFNDGFTGKAPDMGAHEAGTPTMKFGVAGSAGPAVSGSGSVITGTSTPSTFPTPPPTNIASTGMQASSATMDSSSWAVAAGNPVTFTARILGNAATPTGSIAFTSDGASIPTCASVALSGGMAKCTTSALAGGQHKIVGNYSGDKTYDVAVAGPITQTVTGTATAATLPTRFAMDSSSWSPVAGSSVTYTASIPATGGTVAFTDNGSTIAGCGAVVVNNSGVATCTVSIPAGSHAVRGNYSGNGSYQAGVAGPITVNAL